MNFFPQTDDFSVTQIIDIFLFNFYDVVTGFVAKWFGSWYKMINKIHMD